MHAQITCFLLSDNIPPRQPQVVNENDVEKQDAKGDYERKKGNEKHADGDKREGRGEMQQDDEVEQIVFDNSCGE